MCSRPAYSHAHIRLKNLRGAQFHGPNLCPSVPPQLSTHPKKGPASQKNILSMCTEIRKSNYEKKRKKKGKNCLKKYIICFCHMESTKNTPSEKKRFWISNYSKVLERTQPLKQMLPLHMDSISEKPKEILYELGGDKKKTLVMGIVNITPDSFSDGGLFYGGDQFSSFLILCFFGVRKNGIFRTVMTLTLFEGREFKKAEICVFRSRGDRIPALLSFFERSPSERRMKKHSSGPLEDEILSHVETMINKHSVDIIDIGAQSTRPNSRLISSNEEVER